MPRSYDLIVIGGGIVGLSAAYAGAQLGARTLILDRHDEGRATDAGAGILSPETSVRDGRIWYEFAMRCVSFYPTLVAQMNEEGLNAAGIESGFSRCPKLLVAVDEEDVERFESAQQTIMDRQAERNPPESERIRSVDSRTAQEIFPLLNDVAAALYQPVAGRMNGRVLAVALDWAARNQGADRINVGVEHLTIEGERVLGVKTAGGQRFDAGAVLIGGGAWSRGFSKEIGIEIPVEPQKGQIAHLDMAGTSTAAWPIVNGFRGHYIVPWPDNRVAVGATRETDSGYDVKVTAGGLQEVLYEALHTAPGLKRGVLREIRVGLRPYTRDHLPVLGGVPGIENLFLATGHGPTGLQLGPYSGKLVAELALGREPEWDLSPFSIERFNHG